MCALKSLFLSCCLGLSSLALHAQEPSVRTLFLAREAGQIAYDDSGGSGRLVVAIPGMGDLRAQYRFLRPQLIQAGYRVVTLDVRGQGESSAAWQDYSARALAGDVLALLDHLGVERALIIGNSFAAGVGLWAAQQRPTAIEGVAMLGPVLRDLPVSPWLKGIVQLGFAGPWRVHFWTYYWNSLFTLQTPADHAAYRERLQANLREPGRMAALRQMVELSKADTEALLGKVAVPLLVVMGSRDPDFDLPLAEAAWIASKTRAQVSIVKDVGHYPHVERPEIVLPLLMAFFERQKGAG